MDKDIYNIILMFKQEYEKLCVEYMNIWTLEDKKRDKSFYFHFLNWNKTKENLF